MSASDADLGIRLPDTIERPDLQSRLHRGVFAVLSTLGWLVWLYLFAPLLSLLAWALGYQRLHRFVLVNAHHVIFTLVIYAGAVVLAGVLLLAWAVYNLLRFGPKDRRSAAAPVSAAELAEAFRIDPEQVQRLHDGRVLRLHHDAAGHITAVETIMRPDAAQGAGASQSAAGR